MKRRGPVIFVLVLVLLLVFIGGVRYGQRVEKVNKTVSYLISLTPPPPSATPFPTPLSVKYKTFIHKPCSVSFVYPSYMKITKESSQAAALVQDETTQLVFSCERTQPQFPAFDDEKAATITAKTNTLTGRKVFFKLNKDLVPLLENSIKFSLPQQPQ